MYRFIFESAIQYRVAQNLQKMKVYTILVSGYKNGYLITELIESDGLTLEEAAIKAEQKSSLDGASAII